MPFTVHSTWRAPALTAASEFATASPRSSWQWAEITTRSIAADLLPDSRDQFGELGRNGVAHRIGNVDGGCAGLDDSFQNFAKKTDVRSRRVLGRELHVLAE